MSIQRVLTDRGASYRSRLFARTCRELGLKPLFTRPYRPQTNGKAARFIQTVTREWTYARAYASSDQRATFLPSVPARRQLPPAPPRARPPATRF